MFIFVILESCVLANLLLKTCCQKKANSYQFHSESFSSSSLQPSNQSQIFLKTHNNWNNFVIFCTELSQGKLQRLFARLLTNYPPYHHHQNCLLFLLLVAIGLQVAICCSELVIVIEFGPSTAISVVKVTIERQHWIITLLLLYIEGTNLNHIIHSICPEVGAALDPKLELWNMLHIP